MRPETRMTVEKVPSENTNDCLVERIILRSKADDLATEKNRRLGLRGGSDIIDHMLPEPESRAKLLESSSEEM